MFQFWSQVALQTRDGLERSIKAFLFMFIGTLVACKDEPHGWICHAKEASWFPNSFHSLSHGFMRLR